MRNPQQALHGLAQRVHVFPKCVSTPLPWQSTKGWRENSGKHAEMQRHSQPCDREAKTAALSECGRVATKKKKTKAHVKTQRRKDCAKKNESVIPSTPKRFDEYRLSKSVRSCSPDFISTLSWSRATIRQAFLCEPFAALRPCVSFFAFSAKSHFKET